VFPKSKGFKYGVLISKLAARLRRLNMRAMTAAMTKDVPTTT